MTDTKQPEQQPKQKATRTPRTFDSILSGAKNLNLVGKVELRNRLNEWIAEEVEAATKAAEDAKKIAGA